MQIEFGDITIRLTDSDRETMMQYFRNTAELLYHEVTKNGPPASSEDSRVQQEQRAFAAYGVLVYRALDNAHQGVADVFMGQPHVINEGWKLAQRMFSEDDTDEDDDGNEDDGATQWKKKVVTGVRKEGNDYVADVEDVQDRKVKSCAVCGTSKRLLEDCAGCGKTICNQHAFMVPNPHRVYCQLCHHKRAQQERAAEQKQEQQYVKDGPCEMCGRGHADTAQCCECARFGCTTCMSGLACKECIREKEKAGILDKEKERVAAMLKESIPASMQAIEFWGRVLGERRTYDAEWGGDSYHFSTWKGYADAELDRLQRVTHEGRLEVWTRIAAIAQSAFESELRVTAALTNGVNLLTRDNKGAVPVHNYGVEFWKEVEGRGKQHWERYGDSQASNFVSLAKAALARAAAKPAERKQALTDCAVHVFAAYLRTCHIEAARSVKKK